MNGPTCEKSCHQRPCCVATVLNEYTDFLRGVFTSFSVSTVKLPQCEVLYKVVQLSLGEMLQTHFSRNIAIQDQNRKQELL